MLYVRSLPAIARVSTRNILNPLFTMPLQKSPHHQTPLNPQNHIFTRRGTVNFENHIFDARGVY